MLGYVQSSLIGLSGVSFGDGLFICSAASPLTHIFESQFVTHTYIQIDYRWMDGWRERERIYGLRSGYSV